jgi:hypothetical protein
MSSNLLTDFLDLKSFAAEVGRHPRTVKRWANAPNGLPVTGMGNLNLIHVPTAREWLLGRMKGRNTRRAAAAARS